jgi:hypothetical protein
VSFIYGVGVVGFINLVIYLVDQVDLFLWVVALMIWNHRCLDLRVVGFLVMVIIINSFC